MSRALQRQNAIDTLRTAVGWLTEAPALVGVFLGLGVLTAAGQLHPLVSLLGNLVGIVVAGMVYRSAADLAWDRPLGLGENARIAAGRILSLVGIGIVVFVATFFATLLLIIPGIYVGLRLGLAPVACVVDEMGVGDSLSESWEVAQGNLLKLFGIQLVTSGITIVAAVVVFAVTGSFDAFVQNDTTALFRAFLLLAPVTAIVGPIGQFAIARVYLENRQTSETTDDSEENLTAQPGEDGWGDIESDTTGTDARDGEDGNSGSESDPWDDEAGDSRDDTDDGNRWDEK